MLKCPYCPKEIEGESLVWSIFTRNTISDADRKMQRHIIRKHIKRTK